MDIKVEVTVENATSGELIHMMRAALDGVYNDTWRTEEGGKKIVAEFDKAMNDFANKAFQAGRKYEQDD